MILVPVPEEMSPENDGLDSHGSENGGSCPKQAGVMVALFGFRALYNRANSMIFCIPSPWLKHFLQTEGNRNKETEPILRAIVSSGSRYGMSSEGPRERVVSRLPALLPLLCPDCKIKS